MTPEDLLRNTSLPVKFRQIDFSTTFEFNTFVKESLFTTELSFPAEIYQNKYFDQDSKYSKFLITLNQASTYMDPIAT